MQPKSRKSDLHRTELDGQVIVYDEQSDQVHHLDALSAAVYDLADGERSTEELSDVIARERGIASEPELVAVALDELSRAGLLEADSWQNEQEKFDRRRELTRRMAIAGAIAAAIPIVMTITAPKAAAQVTGI